MAKLTVGDFISIATGSEHDATTWQVAKDKDFTKIIDQSIKDYKNVKEWYTMLPKLPEDGPGYYKAEDELYARIAIHQGNTTSNWIIIGPKTQRIQDLIFTEKDEPDIHTTTEEVGMHFTR